MPIKEKEISTDGDSVPIKLKEISTNENSVPIKAKEIYLLKKVLVKN